MYFVCVTFVKVFVITFLVVQNICLIMLQFYVSDKNRMPVTDRICRRHSCVEASAVAESGITHLRFAGFQRQVLAASVLMTLI